MLSKVRPWLALIASTGALVALYKSRQKPKSRTEQVREAAANRAGDVRDRASDAGGAARERLGSLGHIGQNALISAGAAAGKALAKTPMVGARLHRGDDAEAEDDWAYPTRTDDWRKYPQSIGK